MSDVDPRYPIGKFSPGTELTDQRIAELIDEIGAFPVVLRGVVEGLAPAVLEKTYRARGWTVREVVHHVADSHMNSYIRFRLALTEDRPTIKPYLEAEWAKLPDSQLCPGTSLTLIEALHRCWVSMPRGLSRARLRAGVLPSGAGPPHPTG